MRINIIVIIILLSGIFAAAYLIKKYRIAPGLEFEDIKLVDLSGNNVNLNDIEADLLVINFWATWCGPCRSELPALTQTLDRIENEKIVFVMISDESLTRLNTFLSDRDSRMYYLKMQGKFKDIGIHTIPTTYFLNGEKEVIRDHVNGINWHSEKLLGWIESQLDT